MANNSVFVPLSVLLIVTLFGCLLVSCNSKAGLANSERFYTDSKSPLSDMAAGNPMLTRGDDSLAALANKQANPSMASGGIGDFGASDPRGDEMYNPVVESAAPTNGSSMGSPVNGNCFPRDRLSAEDLLPQGAADSRWAQANPAGQGDISDMNFLTAGYHVGVNTTGSSKKNGNLQLRSEPANPQQVVSPWNQATIEPDFLRKPLEIGGDF